MIQLSILLGHVALVAQRPIIIKLSRGRSVGRSVCPSVCPVHCGKTADRIRMPFGIVGRTGPGMRHVVGFGDRSVERGTFGGEFGACHGPRIPTGRMCATAPQRGPLAKFLWADLLVSAVIQKSGGFGLPWSLVPFSFCLALFIVIILG